MLPPFWFASQPMDSTMHALAILQLLATQGRRTYWQLIARGSIWGRCMRNRHLLWIPRASYGYCISSSTYHHAKRQPNPCTTCQQCGGLLRLGAGICCLKRCVQGFTSKARKTARNSPAAEIWCIVHGQMGVRTTTKPLQ